jgi:hypothetical protein
MGHMSSEMPGAMSSEMPTPSGRFGPEHRVRAFAHIQRVAAGETPECDAYTAAFLAGIVRGMGSAQLRRARGLTEKQADAAFLRWVDDQRLLWASVAAMDGAEPEASGEDGKGHPGV